MNPIKAHTDFEVKSIDLPNKANQTAFSFTAHLKYFFAGIIFGIILLKSEAISWYRIQEMFKFQSFHMYGIIGSAIATAMGSIFVIKKMKLKSWDGMPIQFTEKKFHKGLVFGGFIFGLGWAMTGACPGPLFALIGAGHSVIIVSLASAVAGTWVYGWLRDFLPH